MCFCCPVVHIDYPISYPPPTLSSHYLTGGEKACCKPTKISPTKNPIHLLCKVRFSEGHCKRAKPQRHLPHTHILHSTGFHLGRALFSCCGFHLVRCQILFTQIGILTCKALVSPMLVGVLILILPACNNNRGMVRCKDTTAVRKYWSIFCIFLKKYLHL